MQLRVTEIQKTILTHLLTPTGPLPAVFDPDGVYPYQSYCETSSRPVLKKYRFVKLENGSVEAWICPDLGGKVYSLIHKPSGRECLYVPGVVRQSRILPRFSFVAGGIEVSFPISHTPSQNEKVLYEIIEENGRIYVYVGETELHHGMQWTVEYSLREDDQFLTQRTIFKNPTGKAHEWMSWSNAAVPAFRDTEFHFPAGEVLMHSDELKTIDWESEGFELNADIKYMSGFFWKDPDVNAFGCYSPSCESGLYHIAERDQMPGIKLWSYGEGRDKQWSYLSSLNKQSYLEIQAGPLEDQSLKVQLAPGETHIHSEYWFPTVEPMKIEMMKAPELDLRPVELIPLFPYARKATVKVWNKLLKSHELQKFAQIPKPPQIEASCWPPAGMDKLEEAFIWVCANSVSSDLSLWQLYNGVWLLANERVEEAIPLLKASSHDIAKAILARVHFYQNNVIEALKWYESIEDQALALHPQVVVERDKVLEHLGQKAFNERSDWLSKLDALTDEMIVERKIALYIDMEKFNEAKALLLSTNFQKIHQRYEHKRLWEDLCRKINTEIEPYPENLGEDNLAKFGAYRKFEK